MCKGFHVVDMSLCMLLRVGTQAKVPQRKGVRGPHVSDTAPENVSTTTHPRHQRNVGDTLRALKRTVAT